jgi:O-antigen/teichoic acid export membrane protein
MALISRSLLKTLSVYSFGNIINAAVPFLLLPFLTNYLSTADYGIIAIFQIILSFTNPVSGVSVDGAVTREYYFLKDNPTAFGKFVSNGLFIVTVATGFVLILYYFFADTISAYTDFPSEWLWVVLVCSFSNNLIEVTLSIWRVKLKATYYVLFRFLRTLLEMGISILLILYIDESWKSRVEGQLYVSILFALLALFFMWKMNVFRFRFHINKKYLKEIAAFGIPLIPHAIGAVFITMADRLFITNMISIEETGLYSVGFQVAQIISLIQTSFNQAWVPYFYGKLKENSHLVNLKIVKFSYLYFGLMILLVIILTLFSPLIYSLFIGESFSGSIKYVFLISLGFAFNGMYKMVVNYFFYLKKTKFIALITVFTAIINILLNYFLILEYGAMGCAMATVIAFFIQFILVWFFSARSYKMPWFFFLNKS